MILQRMTRALAPRLPHRRVGALVATWLAIGAGVCACGGGGGGNGDGGTDASAQVTLLDADRLSGIGAAAAEAAAARGAPGEAEVVLRVVRARRSDDAVRLARQLEELGFGPLAVLP